MIQPGPTPRIAGRYLVVAPNTVLPRICVRTGRRDDLVEIDEFARVDRAVERAVGGFGALFAYQEAPIRYCIHRAELDRLKRMRRLCSRAILLAIALLAAGIALQIPVLFVGCFVGVLALTLLYKLLPQPLSVAAVWGNQVFLLKIPPEIATLVLRGETGEAPCR